jgi:homoserine O-acetyltransferase
LRRFQLTSDAWGFSQTWYRRELFRDEGFDTTDAFLTRPLPDGFPDANDLLAQMATWDRADISDNPRFEKDFEAALGAITARSIVMPVQTDLYFPPEDSEIEVAAMRNAELRVMPSIWGHRAGSPGTASEDIAFLEQAIADLLDQQEASAA